MEREAGGAGASEARGTGSSAASQDPRRTWLVSKSSEESARAPARRRTGEDRCRARRESPRARARAGGNSREKARGRERRGRKLPRGGGGRRKGEEPRRGRGDLAIRRGRWTREEAARWRRARDGRASTRPSAAAIASRASSRAAPRARSDARGARRHVPRKGRQRSTSR